MPDCFCDDAVLRIIMTGPGRAVSRVYVSLCWTMTCDVDIGLPVRLDVKFKDQCQRSLSPHKNVPFSAIDAN